MNGNLIQYSTCHNNTRRVKLKNPPWGVNSTFLGGCPGRWNPHGPKSDQFKELFATLVFQLGNQTLVMTISTISMCQNCSIWFSAAPGGAETVSANFDPPGITTTSLEKSFGFHYYTFSKNPGIPFSWGKKPLRDAACWPRTCKLKNIEQIH